MRCGTVITAITSSILLGTFGAKKKDSLGKSYSGQKSIDGIFSSPDSLSDPNSRCVYRELAFEKDPVPKFIGRANVEHPHATQVTG